MKRFLLLFVALVSLFSLSLRAEVKSPYTVNFDTSIDTSDHAFKVASNWQHIVGEGVYDDDYGSIELYYMSYSYNASNGVDGTGCLYVPSQTINAEWSSTVNVIDLLVTPKVKGEVKIMVKPSQAANSKIEVYNINEDGTKGSLIKTINYASDTALPTYNTWGEVMLLTADETGDTHKRYGLRCWYMYLDNFEAAEAVVEKEPGLGFTTIVPGETTGTGYWEQQPNGKVKISYTVSVTNTGEVDLHQGDENFTITVWEGKTSSDLFTVPVPQDLAVGETSEPFEVSGEVETKVWGGTYANVKINLRENVSGTNKVLRDTRYNAYEPVFRLCKAGGTTSYTDAINFGLITEEATMALDIYNDGNAPLHIVSMSLPDGFTGLPTPSADFDIQPKQRVSFNVTLPATTLGVFKGELIIKHMTNTGEATSRTTVSGNVVSPDASIFTFGNTGNSYPDGSFADSGISTGYVYSSGDYDYYLKGNSYNANFILPKMHIAPGDKISFDTARDNYSSSYTYKLNLYVSKNRSNWGDPVASYTDQDITSQNFITLEAPLNVTEEGDYYVKFEIPNVRLDNICGPQVVDNPYDLYIKTVDSPDTKQSGQEVSFSVKAVGVANLTAEDYTMEYRTDDQVLYTIEPKTVTAHAKNEVTFNVKFTPVVETTTTYAAYIQVNFVDGSVIKTEPKDLVITFQPDFVFFDKGTNAGSWSKPSNRSNPIKFGTVNEVGISQEYEIYNWGSAPLTVSSITVPEGFTVTPASATVPSKERQLVTITLSAETPGTYEGNLTINYTELDGDKTFELPVSAVLLDPNKWFLEFIQSPSNSTTVEWPAGTIHGKNLNASNQGNYSTPMWGISSSSTTDNMFISPKVHAEDGELLDIYAKYYSGWSTGKVTIYTAATREGLEDETLRTEVGVLTSSADNEDHQLTSDWKVCKVEMPAGDYYIGFVFTDRAYVNYFYGLKKLDVAHDLKLANTGIPSDVMQNSKVTLTASLQNFAPQADSDYTVDAYVDGQCVATAQGVEIPVSTSYSDAATTVGVDVRFPIVGTSKVQLKVIAGEQTLVSDEVEVTVSPEVFSAEAQVGELANAKYNDGPLYLYDKKSEAIMLYTADQLNLSDGDKITSMTFKGYLDKAGLTASVLTVHYAWVDETTLSRPATGRYDLSTMTEVLHETSYAWPQGTDIDLVKVNFETPLTYQSGKSLMICVSTENGAYVSKGSYGWHATTVTNKCYKISNDNSLASQSWSAVKLPVLYLGLAKEAVSVSGTVYDGEAPAAGATVTLVSADGENVQYTTTTGEDGTYTVNVIQNQRPYDITATADGKEDFLLNQQYDETTTNVNFSLLTVVEIDNVNGGNHTAAEGALVKLSLALNEGITTLVLPFDLSAEQLAEFAEANDTEIEVSAYSHSMLIGNNLTLIFHSATAIEAGKPCLVKTTNGGTFTAVLRGLDVTAELNHAADFHNNAQFCGTYESKTLADDEVLLTEENFVEVTVKKARSMNVAQPYSAYAKITNPNVTAVSFAINDEITTGVDEIAADELGEDDVIYNLQGMRVHNPGKGIYIVNGKKVLINK